MSLTKLPLSSLSPTPPSFLPSLLQPTLSSLSKCTSLRIHQITKIQNISESLKKCHLQTDFGDIELLIETISPTPPAQQSLQHRISFTSLETTKDLSPVTYGEVLVVDEEERVVVYLVFREKMRFVRGRDLRVDRVLLELVEAGWEMGRKGVKVGEMVEHVMESEITGRYYVDWGYLEKVQGLEVEEGEEMKKKEIERQIVSEFLVELANLGDKYAKEGDQNKGEQYLKDRIYLIQDSAYEWKISKQDLLTLSQLPILDWFLLGLLMNLPFVQSTTLSYYYLQRQREPLPVSLPLSFQLPTPIPYKKATSPEFGGTLLLSLYPLYPLTFRSGKCTTQYSPISPTSLQTLFFEPLKLYHISKLNTICVQKLPNLLNHNSSFITIHPCISKIDCVQFFIVYMKYFQLSIEKIVYRKQENELYLQLTQGKYITIEFPKSYTVKEEEVSIIINKSTLVECSLELEGMGVSDKLLILLSNIDSSVNIRRLWFRECKELTEFGLNLLFESGNMRGLVELDLSGTEVTEETLEIIKNNLKSLKKLVLNNCMYLEKEEDFGDWGAFEHLEALQTLIDPTFPNLSITSHLKLKVLKLSCNFPIQNLKHLSRMPLHSLKLKLTENKKQQILNFMNNLYTSSSHYTKQFTEGTPHKTLKQLDLTGSTIKYKLIKSLLLLKPLTDISLAHCYNLGDQFDPVNKEVENVNIEGVANMTVRSLKVLLGKCLFFGALNIRGVVGKKEVLDLVEGLAGGSARTINELYIDESQYSLALLKWVNKVGGGGVNRLVVRVAEITVKTERMIGELSKEIGKLVNIECQREREKEVLGKMYEVMGRDKARREENHIRLNQDRLESVERRVKEGKEGDTGKGWLQLGGCTSPTQFIHIIISSLKKISLKSKPLSSPPSSLLRISLLNNRHLSLPIISFLTTYFPHTISHLDIRNCLFTLSDIQHHLLTWQHLKEINNGQFELEFTGENSLIKSERYLKLLMKLSNIRKVRVYMKKVENYQFVFTVLGYIVNHHKLTLEVFELVVERMDLRVGGGEMEEFWNNLFTTITLKEFKLEYRSGRKKYGKERLEEGSDRECVVPLLNRLKQLNHLNLTSLNLNIVHTPQPEFQFLPRILSLTTLSLNLSNASYITDSYLYDLLHPHLALSHLTLDLSQTSLASVDRLSSALSKLKHLIHIDFNFQYCNIKTMQLIAGVLGGVKEGNGKGMRRIGLNVSFTEGCEGLVGELLGYSDAMNHPIMEVVALRVMREKWRPEMEKELEARNITLLIG